jgi:hypothetical protein
VEANDSNPPSNLHPQAAPQCSFIQLTDFEEAELDPSPVLRS